MEVSALGSAYRALRGGDGANDGAAARNPACGLGSVKSNIGHPESAAGLAGVLKVLLAMRAGELPPTLHCEQLNPYLPLAEGGFEVVRELRRWEPRVDDAGRSWPLRAGVSSFGFGGANAHVVLEAPPAPGAASGQAPEPQAIVLSARDADRLRESARHLCDFLERAQHAGHAPALADLAFTLQVGREAMEQRVAFVAGTIDEVPTVLRRYLTDGEPRRCMPAACAVRVAAVCGAIRCRRRRSRRRCAERQLDIVVAAWCGGDVVDWRMLHPAGQRRTVRLPGYPFARERYWVPAGADPPPAASLPAAPAPPPFDPDEYTAVLDAVLDDRVGLDALIDR